MEEMESRWDWINALPYEERARAILSEAEKQGAEVVVWIPQHAVSLGEAMDAAVPTLVTILAKTSEEIPILLMFHEQLKQVADLAFAYGYFLGRTYQDVPEAFKK